ncbi:MAG: VanZ family protein, partial [Schaalia georgiae]|nr:VanZ family protein [Schaalia georgiae]
CTYRVVDIDDVITNTLGTYLGAWLLPRLVRRSWFMRG